MRYGSIQLVVTMRTPFFFFSLSKNRSQCSDPRGRERMKKDAWFSKTPDYIVTVYVKGWQIQIALLPGFFELELGVCYTILTSSKFFNLISRFLFPYPAHFEGEKRIGIYHCDSTSFFSESNCVFWMQLLWKHSCMNLNQKALKTTGSINQRGLKTTWTG